MTPEKPAHEPSMDEILASIRQIISEDSKGKKKPKHKEDNEDILDLTHLLPDESSFLGKPNGLNITPQISPEETTKALQASRQKAERLQPFSKNSIDENLISHSAALETAQALHNLTQLVQGKQQIDGSPLYKEPHNQTLESLTREILKPLLKEWLDANLPLLVRWVVNEQVEKIIRQKNMGLSE